MAWNKSVPVSGSKVLATPSIFQSNWDQMNNILGVEHYGMTESLSGKHMPGYVGAIYVSANATIAGLSNPVTGALAWVTDSGSGMGLIRGISSWKRVHYDLPTTRVRVIGPSSSNATSGTNHFYLSGGTENTDTLGEWNSTSGTFSACEGGYFWFSSTVTLSTTMTGTDTITMGFCGTGIAESASFTTDPSGYASYSFNTLVSAESGVYVAPYVSCPDHTLYTSGGSGISYCQIYRIS